MEVIIVLLLASLSVAVFFLLAYWWGVRNKQFDDTFSPPQRIFFEDHKINKHK